MELIDTPNPNAKKVLVEHDYEIAIYINKENQYKWKYYSSWFRIWIKGFHSYIVSNLFNISLLMIFQSPSASLVRVKKPGPVNIDSIPSTSINCLAIPPTS